jgi:hypothetical protein
MALLPTIRKALREVYVIVVTRFTARTDLTYSESLIRLREIGYRRQGKANNLIPCIEVQLPYTPL